jgi:hypothetical protein
LDCNPTLDQPTDRGGLGAEVIGWYEPVIFDWHQQSYKIVPGLGVVVGITEDWRHDHPSAVFGRCLLCIPLADTGRIIICHDHDILCWAMLFSEDAVTGTKLLAL